MKKIIALGAAAVVIYLIASGTAAAFWSGFWPALHNGPVFQSGTAFGHHYTAAQQKGDMIDFAWVLALAGAGTWGFFRVLRALGIGGRPRR